MQWNLFLFILTGQWCLMVCQLYKYHYINEKKTWTEAQQYCREKHTDLATVSNMEGLNRLLRESPGTTTEAWIGLYDQTSGSRTWHWSLPGVEFNESETNWKHGEPDDAGTENCGMMWKNLRWGDLSCNVKTPFICYNDKVILIKENKTWEDALTYCRNRYHDLVTITNLDEQRWVQEKAKKASTRFAWLPLRYNCTLKSWSWVCPEVVTLRTRNSEGQTDDCNVFGAMETGGQHLWFQRNGGEEYNFLCSKI